MSNRNWNNNSIQFPRLISEIEATGALDFVTHDCMRVVDIVAESMDLDPSEVYELVERASIEWDRIKSHTFAPATAGE
jgi:hypothetical protein